MGEEMKIIVTALMVTLIIVGTFALSYNVQPVRAEGTIHIRADDSIEAQPVAPKPPETQEYLSLQMLQKESNNSRNNSGCGTLRILENIRENWLQSETTIESTTSFYSSRPTDEGGPYWVPGDKQHILPQLYNTTRFIIHYTSGTDGGNLTDAIPLNDTDINGVPDYIENCAESFETSWEIEVANRTFPAPPTDEIVPNDERNRNPDEKYDIFVYHTPSGYLGYAYFEQYPTSPSFSYIGLRNNLEPLETMQAMAAHEFFHAIQFYYDCTEESWWMEASAVYMEDEVFPDSNFNYRYLEDWFELCGWCGLEYDDPYYTWHKYGTFIFVKYLSEEFGNEMIKEIWQEMNQNNGTNGLTAISNTLLNQNSTLLDEFSEFITANFFLEDFYEDGFEYRNYLTGKTWFNGVYIEYEYNATIAPNSLQITDTIRPQLDKWAADYLTLKLDPAKSQYKISFDGLNLTTDYLVKLVTKKDGDFRETVFTLDAQKNGSLDLSYDTFDNVTLIIANVGNACAPRNAWKATIEVISPFYDLEITDVEPSTYLAFTEQNITIAVTVKNNGNMMLAPFNVWTWWGELLLATENVTSLAPGTEETLEVEWTIPAETNGSKRIWANATIVPDDIDLENNRLEDGILIIAVGIHDLSVRNIILAKTIVRQGHIVNIDVIVANQGNYTETFGLATYANTTVANSTVIQTKSVTLESNASAIIVFTWNTTDCAIDNYTISAYAFPVSGETNEGDNSYIGGTIQIVPPAHDIAITDVKSSKTIVGQGYSLRINVTVANQGDYTETFNITVYANATEIETEEVTLTIGNSRTITFTWNTVGWAKGNYTITAYLTPVLGETDLSDNIKSGWIFVTIQGDVDGDRDVDIFDIVRIAGCYGVRLPDPLYNPNCDIDGDGDIDIFDIVRAAGHYGENW